MEILWLAIVFYSIGLGLVLHFRPSLMFHENGIWKEFGYQRASGPESRHTLFPFWLFAIAWAFASYVLAAALTWSVSSPAAMALTAAVGSATLSSSASSTEVFGQYSLEEPEEEEEAETEEEVERPVKRGRGRPRKTQPRAGYYVVAPESSEGGLRRYVYYGENPPTEQNVQSVKINANRTASLSG